MKRNRYKRRARQSGMVGIILCALFVGVVGMLLLTRVFVLRDIRVTGNQTVSYDSIVGETELTLGQSIFTVNTTRLAEAFARDGRLKLEQATVDWPDTVTLTVRERRTAGAIDSLGVFLLIDPNGEMIGQTAGLPDASVPVITGLTTSFAAPGQAIKSGIPGQVEAMVTILQGIDALSLFETVSELNVANLDNLYLMTRGGLLVELGDASRMTEKLNWMQGVLPALAQEGKTTGTLDVSGQESAIYRPT